VQRLLENAVEEAENTSEALAQSFLSGQSDDVAGSMREYRDLRKAYHMRREAKARWDEGRVRGWR